MRVLITMKNIFKKYQVEFLMSCRLDVVVLRQAREDDGVGRREIIQVVGGWCWLVEEKRVL